MSEAFISKLKLDYGHKMKKENQHNLDFVIESLTESIEKKMQNKIKIKEIVIQQIYLMIKKPPIKRPKKRVLTSITFS